MSDLPCGWERTCIGEITLPIIKHDPRKSPGVDIDYIDIGGIDGDRPRIDSTKRYSGGEAPSRARQLVRAGDTVLSTVRINLTKTALVPPRLDGATASTGFSVLRPSEALLPKFLFHQVTHEPFVRLLAQRQTGSSYPAVRDRDVRAMPLIVPPLAEQRRIVAAIEEHFSRLDAAEASLATANERIDMFLAASVNKGFEGIDRQAPLSALAAVHGGIQKQPKRRPVKNKFPFLRVANVKRNQLELDDVHEIELFGDEIDRYRLEAGDLLVVEGNGSPEQIGRSAIWDDQIDDCVHQNHLIRVRPGPDLDSRFLNVFWNSSANSRQLASIASSTSGLYTLSTSKLKRVEVPVVDNAEQVRIADDLDAVFELTDRIRAELARAGGRADALRRSLLAAAFSGHLVPQDPSDEPASVLLERTAAEQAVSKTSRKKKAAS